MRPFKRVGIAAAVYLLPGLLSVSPAASSIQHFRVESVPSGAAVDTITGNAGTTPLSLSERDIYPNTFPEARIELYGMLVVRKPGCREYRHRVTRSDIQQGVVVQLQCDDAMTVDTAAGTSRESAAVSSGKPTAPAGEASAEKRLRQLRVIQELHDEGLLEDREAASIRRRILEAD